MRYVCGYPVFSGFNDHDGYEKWEDHLEDFSVISL